jgi:hypothetical protein
MYLETDARVLNVLERSLGSPGRTERLRAVELLAHIDCADRARWLKSARADEDPTVRDMARNAESWGCEDSEPAWPVREECDAWRTDVIARPTDAYRGSRRGEVGWEYVVEVWDRDAAQVGIYAAITCGEDDRHAKCIALGRAILDSVDSSRPFEPAGATAFIIVKRRHFGFDA